MKAQSKEKLINILVSAGISKDETIAVLCVIKQGNRPLKPSYNIKIERPMNNIGGKGG
jgi:hypothetical protein